MELWNNWENCSNFERIRINAIKYFVSKVSSEFKTNIFSILGGGSFFRREYRMDSDVDLWVIVREDNDIEKVYLFCIKNMPVIMDIFKQVPSIISLEALKRGKHAKKIQGKMGAKRFTFLSHNYIRIYGDKLDYKSIPEITVEKALSGMVNFLKSKMNDFNYKQIAKLYMYVLYYQALSEGYNFPYSFT